MKNLFRVIKEMLHGHWGIYLLTFLIQFFAVAMGVFTTFLSKMVVDALTHDLERADILEKAVTQLLSGGRGPEFIYENFFILPVAVVSCALVSGVFAFLRNLIRGKAAADIFKRMQMSVFQRIQGLPYEVYKQQKEGDLIQTATRDLDLTRRFLFMQIGQITYTLYIVVLCFAILMEISWKLTLVSLSVMPALFFYSLAMIRVVRARYRVTDDAEAVVVDAISENLDGVRIVKAYNEESHEIEKFQKKNEIHGKAYRRHTRTSAFFYSSSDIFIFAARVISLVYSVFLAFAGEITVGTIAIAFAFVNMMVWPLRDSATTLARMGETLAACDRIVKLFDLPQEDIEVGDRFFIRGDVEMKDVHFSYPDTPDTEILSGLTFHIKAGQSVALMGKTGSGKSSLFYLLTRLYDPSSGEILIDGKNIQEIQKKSLRAQIVPVWQDPFLFSKSIGDNIRIADNSSNKERMEKAARVSDVEDAISSFPMGYDTPVGEKGVTLSGGQRQRIALARALLVNPPVLLLDDSLSAVDMETDLKIRSNLKAENRSTTFLITHRIASAKDCDVILVLDDGKIAQQGTHEELLKQEGLYRRIAEIQDLEGGRDDG